MPLADLKLESIAGLPVAHFSGEIDRSNAAELGDRVASAIPDQSGLVVDLSELAFLDSTGIRMLFGLAIRLKQRHQSLRVVVHPRASGLPRRTSFRPSAQMRRAQ